MADQDPSTQAQPNNGPQTGHPSIPEPSVTTVTRPGGHRLILRLRDLSNTWRLTDTAPTSQPITINASTRPSDAQKGQVSPAFSNDEASCGSYDPVRSVGSAYSIFGEQSTNHYEHKMNGKDKGKSRQR